MSQAAPSTRKLMKIAESALAKGRGQEAWDALQQVLKINPHHLEALHQSGFMLHSAGHYREAEQCYRLATQVDPEHFVSHQEIMRIMEAQDRGNEALQYAQTLAQRMPGNKHVHLEFIRQMMRFNHVHLVPRYADEVLARFPEDGDVLMQKALALRINGQHEEAETLYVSLKNKHKLPTQFRLMYELHLPRNYRSVEEIDACRARFSAAVDAFLEEKPRYAISTFLYQPVFQLAFHHRENKELLQRYTRMLRGIAPELNFVAPHCKQYTKPMGRPLKIGYISRFMHNHSVGSCYRNVMIHLGNQPDMEVTLFNPANVMDDKIQEILNSKVKLVVLPKMLESAQQTIAQHQLDLVIFPDIGMDAMTHYLAMARLAPIQLCLQGHPETTGIDTIDHFISTRPYEPAGAQANYTEKLLCIPGMDTIFKRATAPEQWLTRGELNLPEDKKLYVCPMAIQKFHPDFDYALADILARDPDARIVLFNDFQQQTASDALRARITAICGSERVQFMPWLKLHELLSVLKEADCLLDTFYFGGGTTIQYAFSFGFPMVSMPSTHARGRMVHAYYQVMGVENPPLASTPEEYAQLAVTLAHTPTRRAELQAEILAKNSAMFDQNHCGDVMAGLVRDLMADNLSAYQPS